MDNFKSFITALKAELKDDSATDTFFEGFNKSASEKGADENQIATMNEFMKCAFQLCSLTTEDLVKKALGQLGDKPEQVDSFLAGIDEFIEQNKMDKTASDNMKIAIAVEAMSKQEPTPESTAIFHLLTAPNN